MTQAGIWISRIFFLTCNHAPRFKRKYFIAPLKVCSGTQENKTDFLFLNVVGNITILMCINIGTKYELVVLVISKILAHDYILCRIHTRYPIVLWILIDAETHKPDHFNGDSAWDILEWESADQLSFTFLD